MTNYAFKLTTENGQIIHAVRSSLKYNSDFLHGEYLSFFYYDVFDAQGEPHRLPATYYDINFDITSPFEAFEEVIKQKNVYSGFALFFLKKLPSLSGPGYYFPDTNKRIYKGIIRKERILAL
jgi:hypothetical protein